NLFKPRQLYLQPQSCALSNQFYFSLQTKPILKVKQFLLFQSQMIRVSEILQFSNKL
ncbi:hypothetical protein AKI91_07025, partial [Streptococcus pneumoniae]